ncbi:MAG: xanthine dehydrogenase family protein subunit M [Pseudomonadota bacterium]
MYNFDYVKPGSVAEAITALQSEDAVAMSGGQTLLPTMKARLAQPSTIVDLSGMAELTGITVDAGKVTIGGATRHVAVETSSEVQSAFPALAALAGGIGDPQVRNRGTIGGSVANNDPAACYPSACLGTGATIHTSTRTIAADDFFQGMFDTALEEGELVTGVSFPIPSQANYQKFVQPASRFALVGVFVAKFDGGVRVAVTGASEEGVHRWTAAEAALSANFSPDAVPDAPPAEGMIGDIHGSPEYRAHIVQVMTKRAVAAA